MMLETRGKPISTPFSSPFPAPNNTVSMKMPQNTPNAVSAVRSLCRLNVLKISCHFSTSIMRLLRAHRFDGRDLRGPQRRHEPRDQADADEQRDSGHRHAEVHFGIREVSSLHPGLAHG